MFVLTAQTHGKKTENQICGIAWTKIFQLNFDTSQINLTIKVINHWLKQIQIWFVKHVVCVVQTL